MRARDRECSRRCTRGVFFPLNDWGSWYPQLGCYGFGSIRVSKWGPIGLLGCCLRSPSLASHAVNGKRQALSRLSSQQTPEGQQLSESCLCCRKSQLDNKKGLLAANIRNKHHC